MAHPVSDNNKLPLAVDNARLCRPILTWGRRTETIHANMWTPANINHHASAGQQCRVRWYTEPFSCKYTRRRSWGDPAYKIGKLAAGTSWIWSLQRLSALFYNSHMVCSSIWKPQLSAGHTGIHISKPNVTHSCPQPSVKARVHFKTTRWQQWWWALWTPTNNTQVTNYKYEQQYSGYK